MTYLNSNSKRHIDPNAKLNGNAAVNVNASPDFNASPTNGIQASLPRAPAPKGARDGNNGATLSADLTEAEPAALIHLRSAIRAGAPWHRALLDAIALWTAPEEVCGERFYRYFIWGEALDWLTLAERLGAELWRLGAIAEDELERFLFEGELPPEVTPEVFKERLGGHKYRAYLNYWYGVVVEEALQQAVEEESRKQRRARCYPDSEDIIEEAFTRLYGQTRTDLLKEYREKAQIPTQAPLSLADGKGFAYWLSKLRFNLWDPARVASDTRKGIRKLKQLEQIPGPLTELEQSRSRETPAP